MADLTKLKRWNTLGAPPPLEEASQNLQAPEHAPVVPLRAEHHSGPLSRFVNPRTNRRSPSAAAQAAPPH